MKENHYTLELLDNTATPCTRCGARIHFVLAGFRDGQPLCRRCFRLELTDLAPILGLIATALVRGTDLLVPGEDCEKAEEEILAEIRQTLLLRSIRWPASFRHRPPIQNHSQQGITMKPERIQMGLAKLPGWQHDEASEALVRRFEFPSPRAAATYALYLSEITEAQGFYPRLELQHNSLMIIVPGGSAGLDENHFEQARQLTQPF